MYNFEKQKILIVGAGLAGCTLGRILAENSFKVVIIEKRNHIAGNLFDYLNQKDDQKLKDYIQYLKNNADIKKYSLSDK